MKTPRKPRGSGAKARPPEDAPHNLYTLLSAEARAEIEDALLQIAVEARENFEDRPEMVGYFMRKARNEAFENNGLPHDPIRGDALFEQLEDSVVEGFRVIDGQLGWLTDSDARPIDGDARDYQVMKLVHDVIRRAVVRYS